MIITVASSDPGTKNYGFSVVRFKKEGKVVKYKIVKTCKVKHTADIKEKDIKTQIKKYLREVKSLTKGLEVTHLSAERYMTRGIKGPLVESVNMMLGALVQNNKQPVTLLPAVVWKNKVNKMFDLKEFYKEVRVEAHEVDAVLMAFYTAEKILEVDVLTRFRKKSERNKLKKVIEECTLSPLRKDKKKR